MPKQLLLHLGHDKTGSSYLQTVFASSSELLLNQGIFYPAYTCGVAKAIQGHISSGNIDQKDEVIEIALKAELDCPQAKRLLLSNEHLYYRLLNGSLDLRPCLESGYRISALLFIRDPVEHFFSGYSQLVKRGGETRDISALTSAYNTPADVIQVLRELDRLEVAVTVVNYSRHRDALLEKAAQWLEVSPSVLIDAKDAIVNRSLTHSESKLQKLFSEYFGKESSAFISDPLCNELPRVEPDIPEIPAKNLDQMLDNIRPAVQKVNSMISKSEHYQLESPKASHGPAESANSNYQFSEEQLEVLTQAISAAMERGRTAERTLSSLAARVIELRDLALEMEKRGDYSQALVLMQICKILRPNGPVINKKVQHYQRRLKI
ncbi:hypothetical protein EY643_01355 [Halioglobus maricola]|uniref:Uncharacterized protein n=1 Tax=Halioglobus maricola TaxID=2601894 RepID=A0A5P9NFN8_9GAMM|nr:hypothetical protein [Halioglobus maricola]QFU74405.1 hypothetical protein EY643_01355 [Halioglobus maricola]